MSSTEAEVRAAFADAARMVTVADEANPTPEERLGAPLTKNMCDLLATLATNDDDVVFDGYECRARARSQNQDLPRFDSAYQFGMAEGQE